VIDGTLGRAETIDKARERRSGSEKQPFHEEMVRQTGVRWK
jgi:hypothetical protein